MTVRTERARGARRVTMLLLRVVATVEATLLCLQPVSIGLFLHGQFGMLSTHGGFGSLVAIGAMFEFAACLLVWRPGRVAGWPVAVAASMMIGTIVQLVAGYQRVVALHVPLGVALVATGVFLASWSWRTPRVAS